MSTKLHCLSYDDEPDNRLVTEIALSEKGGFTLDVCASGPEAISRISAFKPDLIILDVVKAPCHCSVEGLSLANSERGSSDASRA